MGGLLHLYSKKDPWWAAAPVSPLPAIPNVPAHPSTASVQLHWKWHIASGLLRVKQMFYIMLDSCCYLPFTLTGCLTFISGFVYCHCSSWMKIIKNTETYSSYWMACWHLYHINHCHMMHSWLNCNRLIEKSCKRVANWTHYSRATVYWALRIVHYNSAKWTLFPTLEWVIFFSCAAGSSNVPRLDQLYCFTSNCILMLTNGQTDKHMIVWWISSSA